MVPEVHIFKVNRRTMFKNYFRLLFPLHKHFVWKTLVVNYSSISLFLLINIYTSLNNWKHYQSIVITGTQFRKTGSPYNDYDMHNLYIDAWPNLLYLRAFRWPLEGEMAGSQWGAAEDIRRGGGGGLTNMGRKWLEWRNIA